MKKLFAFVVVVALIAGGGLVGFRHSVLFSLYEMSEAGKAGDLKRLEAVADIDSWAKTGVDFSAAYTETRLKKSGGALGGLVGGLASAFLSGTKDASAPDIAEKARERIRQGDALSKVGPWTPAQGVRALDKIEIQGDLAYVTLNGTCETESAPARIVFQRLTGGGPLGLLDNWKTTGMEPADLQRVVDACIKGEDRKK